MRQHAAPILIDHDKSGPLTQLPLGSGPGQISEKELQELIHHNPKCLPIAEIDPMFVDPVPLCMELTTIAGSIDNLMVTASGLPVLVECKLWRNPEARRHVVGQILDYAKQLTRWSASDFQREVAKQIGGEGNPVLRLLEAAKHKVEEIAFNDALTHNLRRGRFLLLIVGDGIREGVEAIAEYLEDHAGLHFSLGLVELPVFLLPDGSKLVAPRVLARTALITREVIALPEGFGLSTDGDMDPDSDIGLTPEEGSRREFMLKVVEGLKLTDPEQPLPKVTPKGWLYVYLPAPASTCWIGVLDKTSPTSRVGIRLTSNKSSIGEAAIARVLQDWPLIRAELGGNAVIEEISQTRFLIEEFLEIDRRADADSQAAAAAWVRDRLRDFVSVFRPRIRDAVEQMRDA